MSLFIAGLAVGDSPLFSWARLGISGASLLAGAIGCLILVVPGKRRQGHPRL